MNWRCRRNTRTANSFWTGMVCSNMNFHVVLSGWGGEEVGEVKEVRVIFDEKNSIIDPVDPVDSMDVMVDFVVPS